MKSDSTSKVLAKKKSAGGILDTLRTIVYAVLIALVVRTVAYEPFNIPSGSMIPTLLVGDYLFVSKYSYGYSRFSLPFGLPLFPGRVLFHSPERGDVVVFKVPTNNSDDFIKRIVGLPGDRLQMRQGILYINDQPATLQRLGDYPYEQVGMIREMPEYMETLPNGRRHPVIKLGFDEPLDNTAVYQVPPGEYFMMGDNRDDSSDSRAAFGGNFELCVHNQPDAKCFVPAENLVGRAEFIFFSTDGAASLWQFWKWPFAIRYSRLFHGIN